MAQQPMAQQPMAQQPMAQQPMGQPPATQVNNGFAPQTPVPENQPVNEEQHR
jgi:cell division septation protein DedD